MSDILTYKNEPFVAIEIRAEGYYSGAVESHVGFMTLRNYHKYEEQILSWTPCFYGLDGKHSEVDGEVVVHTTKLTIAKAFASKTGDWKFAESLMERIWESDEECQRLVNLHQDISKKFTVSTMIDVDFDGETLYINV